MLDPDNIILVDKNENNNLTIESVPEFDFMIWDYDDPKDVVKFFKQVEKETRSSFEYREMIQYLKDYCGMDQCSFIQVSKDNNIKIEVHHYPFTLYDIVSIVYKKRCYYQESIDTEMVAKECTMLHYKVLVGLISLSKTVHQLVHDGKLFIPVDNVFGRYDLFVELYKPFCDEEQLDTLNRIELYSREYSDLQDRSILDMNTINYYTTDSKYQLPNMNSLQLTMVDRIDTIKNNNYRLPTIEEYIDNSNNKDSYDDRRSVICPFIFDKEN